MADQIINERYKVESHLGRGNQGDVLLALDLKLGRHVALKLLRMGGSFDSQAEQSLRREAMVMAKFHHPNVVSVHDYDVTSDNGWPFLVMEYLQGDTLDKNKQPLTDLELRAWMEQVGGALQRAHEIGLVHRDLKPANLMLVDRSKSTARFMILDLGIAKLTDAGKQGLETFGSMTFSGAGTPFYMAPEQAKKGVVDHRADIYAMGSMMYEFLSGHSPFADEAESLMELLQAVVNTPPKPLRDVAGPNCTEGLHELVTQCLEKDPKRRPDSMAEVVQRFLSNFVPDQSVARRPHAEVMPPPVDPRLSGIVSREHELDSSGQTLDVAVDSAASQATTKISDVTQANVFDATARDVAAETNVAPIETAAEADESAPDRRLRSMIVIAATICVLLVAGIMFKIMTSGGAFNEVSEIGQSVPTQESEDRGDGSSLAKSKDNAGDTSKGQAVASGPKPIDFGEYQLTELVPWTMRPEFAGENITRFELAADSPEGLTIDPQTGRLSWLPTEQQGPGRFPVSVEATLDDDSRVEARLMLTVEESNQPPTISPIAKVEADELTEIRFTVKAQDADYPTPELVYRLVSCDVSSARIDAGTGEFRWTPSERDGPGNFEVTIEVSDGITAANATVSIVVNEVNLPPVVSRIAPIKNGEGKLIAFTINATDADLPANELTYSLITTDLDGAAFDVGTRRFTWTPAESHGPGNYTASFLVSDGAMTTRLDVPITVDEIAQPPAISPIPTQRIGIAEPLHYRVTATDPDLPASPLTYSLAMKLPNMTIDAMTGEIKWAPELKDLGKEFRVEVLVSKSDDLIARALLSIEVSATAEIANSIGMQLRLIPAGEFQMGSPEDEQDHRTNETLHRVVITNPFLIGVHEVTRGQFAAFVRETGYKTDAETERVGFGWHRGERKFKNGPEFNSHNLGFAQTDDHPVVNVTWNDATKFCEWLSEKEGEEYRLPTEAEWEYSCRAGSTTAFNFGADKQGMARVANIADSLAQTTWGSKDTPFEFEPHDDKFAFTSPKASFPPNDFGLYDMHGNVGEWCQDWYGAKYYATSPVEDPQGPREGTRRVVRGGGWFGYASYCRSSYRSVIEPTGRSYVLGFRVVRNTIKGSGAVSRE